MIQTKADLKYYLAEDKNALGINKKHPCFRGHDVWKFQISLRYVEYYFNKRIQMTGQWGGAKEILAKISESLLECKIL